MKPITLLTDFGDFYPGVMKGVILKICPNATIVDISHSVEPQNVHQGAFLLYHSYRFFPNAVHVAVVDPGVGSSRKAIAIECNNHIFIGPDNGVLYPSASDDGMRRVWVIDESKTSKITGVLSSTFHGRDVFAPASAYAVFGKLEEVAEPYDGEIRKLDLFDYEIEGDKIRCRIIFIDRFGNAVTNVRAEDIGDAKGFYINGVEFPLVNTYSNVGIGEPLALIGSFETLELSVRNGNASEKFNLKSGEIELRVIG
jgi:S-adenosylmethionine hydrolase